MEQLNELFRQWAGMPPSETLAIGSGGSSRRYFRLVAGSTSAVGCIADDIRENEAFFAFTSHFRKKGVPVPQLYSVAPDRRHYLQQDLGDQTLYGLLYDKKKQGRGFDAEMLSLYRQALADLAAIQQAGADLDFSVASPRAAFDRRSILWDLNYFKYCFLKISHIHFDEELLENDFNSLADRLLAADCSYFLYRDFQSRNIMLTTSPRGLYYIDYQGGRRGATQYDVASLLYSAKSNLPETIRTELLNHYLDVRNLTGDQRRQWLDDFWFYLLMRILQTLGAYGYRGLVERKPYFIESIPLALANLRRLAEDHPKTLHTLPHLADIISRLTPITSLRSRSTSTLTLTLTSFSYKQGLPDDPSGNGGGHVFDCRALPNPGRYPQYKAYTGKDRPVVEFLQREPAVDSFLANVKGIVAQSVEKYLERNFTHLMVSFGCTGGQHRSVYCAEQIAAWLQDRFPAVNVILHHREQEIPNSQINKPSQSS